ncbi:molecular chaperone HtpG [Porphyromonas sp. COT-239 OH1446]|uniref:molecular chaperone HtpG n=1 Tax=Porphyromonas sp. COT-239 OH1446 TaxID=1515613 RepID=UPI00052D2113|nr:molecular chaperone HtpG [Porphyromonas sp. COT-239 OH1446]KGN69975.1 molecular chaperone Hsp90 [Porphyromonas sp. COT-239 OH1446]
MSKNGKIGVTSENIFPVIKKFLYSEHDIFLRELVSNAVDASQKLRALSSLGEFKGELGDLKVMISTDPEAGTITISDRGIGMSAEEVDKYINQIAFSGAEEFLDKYKDDKLAIIGHFGLGFYSSFMVAKRVDIITKSYREDAQAVKWSCDGSPEYTLEEVNKADRGTDIVLHIDEESKEFLDKSRIEGLLNKYCKFLTIPVVFGKKQEWKDGKMQDTDEDNQINDTHPAWTRKPSELKEEDYKDFYRQLYPMNMEEPLFWIHLNVDYPFNLTGILYFPKIKNQMELQRNKIQLYCNQVFVTEEVEGIVPEYLTLLHGVLDSPDIPLNVSRSYLQSDAQVKKIASHITKKVADRLEEIFKSDRTLFEEKWDSLKIFVQYGMLSDEKFYDRAKKFVLMTDVEGKKFTLDEYRSLIEGEQTDKDGQLIQLYTTDPEAQYSHIQRAQAKGYSVLVLDGPLDVHAVGQLEQKLDKTRFVRVDSDSIGKLIVKDEHREVTLSTDEQERLRQIFTGRLPEMEKKNFHITFEALGESAEAILITQAEFMRRMQEMARLQPGMSFYGEMPESYSVILNSDHALIGRILADEDKVLETALAPKREELTAQTALVDEARKAQEGKKAEEISEADRSALEDLTFKQAQIEGSINSELKAYGAGNDLVGQLVDLALLGSGLLTGEALAHFIQRSQRML